jgi:hypothetical protein
MPEALGSAFISAAWNSVAVRAPPDRFAAGGRFQLRFARVGRACGTPILGQQPSKFGSICA